MSYFLVVYDMATFVRNVLVFMAFQENILQCSSMLYFDASFMVVLINFTSLWILWFRDNVQSSFMIFMVQPKTCTYMYQRNRVLFFWKNHKSIRMFVHICCFQSLFTSITTKMFSVSRKAQWWYVWCFDFLFEQASPGDSFKERMFFNAKSPVFKIPQSLGRVTLK